MQVPSAYRDKTVQCLTCRDYFVATPAEELPFEFTCPICNSSIEAERGWAGMPSQCPTCKLTIQIPEPPFYKPPCIETTTNEVELDELSANVEMPEGSPYQEKSTSIVIPSPPTLVAIAIGCVIILSGYVLFSKPKAQVVTGYETEILFVEDSNYSAESKFNELTHSGWEIKSSRRAWASESRPYADVKLWGTEYTLQKPIYGNAN